MKKLYTLTLTLFVATSMLAQNDDDITANRVRQTLSTGNVSAMSSGMRTLPLNEGETIGDYYLQEELVATNFVMQGDEIYEGFPAKYNIKGNFFAVMHDSTLKYLSAELLKAFTFVDPVSQQRRVFLSERVMPNTVELIKGFWEIHHNGKKAKLISKKEIEMVEANYNVSLDIGDRNSKIKKKTVYYILENNEYKKITKFKKKNLYIFGDQQKEIGSFIKSNKIDAESEEDLVKLVQHYEGLITPI